LIIARRII